MNSPGLSLTGAEKMTFASKIHDRMTELVLPTDFSSFGEPEEPSPVRSIPVLKEGKEALRQISEEMGLGFDDWDLQFIYLRFHR